MSNANVSRSERTFIMIKPDGVQRGLIGNVIQRFETKGYKLVALKFNKASEELLRVHYVNEVPKSFFPSMLEYMMSGPVIQMVWEGLNVVKGSRMLIGETDMSKSLPGTIRGDLCIEIGRNVIHGSDSVETASAEIDLWFKPEELVQWKSGQEDSKQTQDKIIKAEIVNSLKEVGNRLFREAKYEEALEKYTEGIKIISNAKSIDEKEKQLIAQLYHNRASVFAKLGSNEDVVRETTFALNFNPKYGKALFKRCEALRNLGRYRESLADVDAMGKLEDNEKYVDLIGRWFPNPAAYKKKLEESCDDLIEKGALDALELIKKRKQVFPSKHFVKRCLQRFINCPISNGQLQPVGRNSNGGYNLALDLLKSEDYDAIIDLCTQELESPKSKCKIQASYLRGTFRYIYCCYEGTLEDFDYVIEKSEDSELIANAYIKKAVHFYNFCDYYESLCNFELAQRISENPDIGFHRGQVQLYFLKIEEALKDFLKAIKLQPDYASAHASYLYAISKSATSSGSSDNIKHIWSKFTELTRKFPSSSDVFYVFGMFLMENKLYAVAEKNFSKALELDPKNVTTLVKQTLCSFYLNEDADEAIEKLENALKIDNKNEDLYSELSDLYLHKKLDTKQALKFILEGIKVATTFKVLRNLCSDRRYALHMLVADSILPLLP